MTNLRGNNVRDYGMVKTIVEVTTTRHTANTTMYAARLTQKDVADAAWNAFANAVKNA